MMSAKRTVQKKGEGGGGGYIRKHAVDSGSKVGQSGGPCGRFQRGGQAKCISPPRVQARRASQFCRTPSTLTAGLAPARSAKPRRTASPFPHSRQTPKPPPAHLYRSKIHGKPLTSKQKQRQTKPIAMHDANETNAQTGKNDKGKSGGRPRAAKSGRGSGHRPGQSRLSGWSGNASHLSA